MHMHTNIHYKTYKTKTVKKLALTAEYNLNLVQKVNYLCTEGKFNIRSWGGGR